MTRPMVFILIEFKLNFVFFLLSEDKVVFTMLFQTFRATLKNQSGLLPVTGNQASSSSTSKGMGTSSLNPES